MSDGRDLALRWSGRVSLTPRILAVNIFALALLAGGFFYLDTYRSRILDSRDRAGEPRGAADRARRCGRRRRDARRADAAASPRHRRAGPRSTAPTGG